MRIHCVGGAAEVGASCLVVEAGRRRVLVDCGVRPGAADPLPDLRALQQLGGVEAVVVTHAHADHIGALPLAVPAFPAAHVTATPATADLMAVMLADAVRIGEQRAQEGGDLPPYGRPAVEALLARVRPVPFGQPFPLLALPGEPAWQLTYFPAGHVLGAAMALLETPEGSVLVSGDVSLTPQRTVGPAVPPRRRVDVLVLESTYGDRLHSARPAEEARLVAQVQEVVGRGGHCLIPAFALGRAQEVLLVLAEARRQGRLAAPVWVDGLVRAVCGVYERHGDAGTERLRRRIARQANPFLTADGPVRAVARPADRHALLAGPPAVIVSSSGMLLGGPSAFYAGRLAPDERHAILITGYQDEEAPGRRLLELAEAPPDTTRTLVLAGAAVPVRCALSRYTLSAHADGDELASLAERLRPRLALLVHGNDAAREALATKLAARGCACRRPANGASVDVPAGRRDDRAPPLATPRPDPTIEQLVALTTGAPPARGWTALELAERHYGAITADGVAAVARLLAAGDAFTADHLRPTVYRLVPSGAATGPGGPVPQELLRQRLQEVLGDDPTLLRAGLYPAESRAELRFHFPDVAARRHGAAVRALAAETGWRIDLRHTPDGGALQRAAVRHLPAGLAARTTPSLHLEAQRVTVAVAGGADAAALAAAAERFRAETGYELAVRGDVSWPPPAAVEPTALPGTVYGRGGQRPLDTNSAFGTIRAGLAAAGATVYRVSQQGDRLEVTFLTPAVGRRYAATLDELADRVGWPLVIAAQPHQGAVIDVVRAIVGRRIGKGPGIHAEAEQVRVRLAPGERPDDGELAGWRRAVRAATGYRLEVELVPELPSSRDPLPVE